MTREQLLILLVLAFVLLINLTVRVLRRWIRGEAPRGIEPEVPQVPPPGHRLPPPVVRSPGGFARAHRVPRCPSPCRSLPPVGERARV